MANRNSHSYRMTLLHKTTPLFDTDIDCDPGRQFDAIVINFALVCLVITHLLSNSTFLQFAKRLQVSDTDMSRFLHTETLFICSECFFWIQIFCLLFCFGDCCSCSMLSISLNFLFTG